MQKWFFDKKRKGNTIGYRGIGFKSIVNYSSVVHLISGKIKITFSKDLSKEELNIIEQVPLIRIPHSFVGHKYSNDIDTLINNGFNTIFIFEVRNNEIEDEIKKFDRSCLLFMNNLQNIFFHIDGTKNKYSFKKNDINNETSLIELTDNIQSDEWLVITNNNPENRVDIAFKYKNGKVVEMDANEHVIHSFMPTNDQLTVHIKLNGDFSTDPSRTRIVQDDYTNIALEECSQLVFQIMKKIFDNKSDYYGLMKIFSKIKLDPLSRLRKAL